MEDTARIVRTLLRDLGSPNEAIRYIDNHLSAEGRANYADARRALLLMVGGTFREAVGEYNADGTLCRFSNPIRVF
jgi:hypothetical protein